MTPLLLNNNKWTPSLKKFYNTYHSTAHFIGCSFPTRDPIAKKYKDLYRVRNSFTYREGVYLDNFTVYTNSFDLLEELISDNFYKEKLYYIATPKDQEHHDVLSLSSEKIEFRSKFYYGKYEYKLESLINYYRNPPESSLVDSAVKHITENFTDTRMAYHQGRLQVRRTWFVSTPPSVVIKRFPTIYTNDAGQLFMFKLAFGNDLELEITKTVVV